MKRFIVGTALLLTMAVSVFAASSDLTPVAVVKLNGSDTITVKTIKDRVTLWAKMSNVSEASLDQKKAILENLIYEKLVVQAAAKDGLSITDSQVDQLFLNTMSQSFGQKFDTESQLSDFLQKQVKKSLASYVKEATGYSLTDYKAYLKNSIIAQQYIVSKCQDELKNATASDQEIKEFYSANKARFVWDDTVKLFLVMVPKGNDAAAAKKKANKILKDYKANKDSSAAEKALIDDTDNHKAFEAGYMLMTSGQAQQYRWDTKKVVELLDRKKNYVSELSETDVDFQFYVVKDKFAAKMLTLDDIVQPEAKMKVSEYIKQYLVQQKQNDCLLKAAETIPKGLDTKSNVQRKKEGEELDKLLNWES